VDPCGPCAVRFTAMITANIKVPVAIVAEFRRGPWSYPSSIWTSHQAGSSTAPNCRHSNRYNFIDNRKQLLTLLLPPGQLSEAGFAGPVCDSLNHVTDSTRWDASECKRVGSRSRSSLELRLPRFRRAYAV
jgi:hypothetical protein